MYDHSIRVPFLVAGPKVKSGLKLRTPIYLQDVMPTSLEIGGAPKPETCEFNSFLSRLGGEGEESSDPAIYGAYLGLQRCVTYQGWKLIVYPKPGVVRLYNLEKDPHELNDLANEQAHRSQIKLLFAKLLQLQVQFADKLDLRSLFPNLVASLD